MLANPKISISNVRLCSVSLRHALPLFTSLLNVVCAYDPVGYGIPYNHLMFSDQRGALAELALQVLIVSLEQEFNDAANTNTSSNPSTDPDSPSSDTNMKSPVEGSQVKTSVSLYFYD